MSTTENDFVTLATFSFVSEALVLASKLEDEGIPHMMPEYNTSSMLPAWTGMQVRVLVMKKDLEIARQFIAPSGTADAREPEPKSSRLKNFGLFLLGIFLGAPMRRSKPGLKKDE